MISLRFEIQVLHKILSDLTNHLQERRQSFIYVIYTHHVALFCDSHLISAMPAKMQLLILDVNGTKETVNLWLHSVVLLIASLIISEGI